VQNQTLDLDRRIKELEAQLKEQELREKASARPLIAQSALAALPIILTIGLGFVANYFQSRHQHQEQLGVIARQGELEREKQAAIAKEAESARLSEAKRSFTLQERDAAAQLDRQEREFRANAAAAADRFAQEQRTLRTQHAAQQGQQAREFDQSLERQRRQNEVELILKASEVPTSLTPQEQDIQRARNLLWFADAGYIRLSEQLNIKLRDAGRISQGESVSLPVVQSAGGTAAIDLLSRFESFSRTASTFEGGNTEIGYGHFLTAEEKRTSRVRIGNELINISSGISEEQARVLLRQDMAPYYKSVDTLVKVPLTPSQRDALAVFVYNVGPGVLARSSLLKRLNNREYDAVPNEMRKWIRAAGRQIPGLQQRREAEIELWNRTE